MAEKIHAMHGRDHLPRGADPIPVQARFTPLVFDSNVAIETTAAGKGLLFTIPSDLDGMTLVAAEAFVGWSPSSAADILIDILRYYPDLAGSNSSFFPADYLTIDAGEYTSLTSAVTAAIDSSTACNAGDYIRIKVVDMGTGDALGLGLHLTFGRPTP